MRHSPLQPVSHRRRRSAAGRAGQAGGSARGGSGGGGSGGRRRERGGLRPWLWGLGAIGMAAVAAAGTGLVRAALHSGEPLPGTRVAGVAVDGRKGPALERRIMAAVGARLTRPVAVVAGSGKLTVVPADVLAVDAVRTAARARQAGRGSVWTVAAALLSPSPPTREVEPVLRLRKDGLAQLTARLATLGSPPRNAAVVVVGATPRAVPGRPGVVVDAAQLAESLRKLVVVGGAGPLSASLREAPPPVDMEEAQAAVARARRLLAAPVALRVGGRPAGALQPEQLGKALRIVPGAGVLVPKLDADALWGSLSEQIASFRSRGVDARYRVQGKQVTIVPSVDGRDVQPGVAADKVLQAMQAASGVARVARLTLVPVPAPFSSADAKALGIRTRVASFTTQMGDSSANRIHNVHLMADYIDGTIVKPGATFSFNAVVGPRTAERGFREGQAIFGTVTVASIGGGVCQTATTLFNDAFVLGLPIVARSNHSTYISHYPVGRDATVSWGGPDLIFRNDMANSLLIKASYTDRTLTFSVYGTPQARKVMSVTGSRTNVVPPQVHNALDLNAAPGTVTTSAGSGAPGFDITVQRKVYEDGKLLRSDSFRSHYQDEGPTRLYGPGQAVPRPYIVIPRENV